ncbi:MAG: SAM-dependent methyltransferase [Pyrinomonadaceae bacterium]|nr:SAM-dependent methyltransferase [Pyrinomonadaceae bacterium]
MIAVSTSKLAEQLRERIRRDGPITFREWMSAALYDPVNGYYCRVDRNKWGREGDYRTSPERSSLFGATLARYIVKLYEESAQPSPLTITESGGGDGSFAVALLETLQLYFPGVLAATRYVIDEISPNSQSQALKRLGAFADRVSFESVGNVQIDFGIVFSNELLDAFPVHRVKMEAGQLREFYVNVSAGGEFEWLLAAPSTKSLAEYFEKCGVELGEGQVAEVNLEIEPWLKRVAGNLRSGYVITVDYGAEAAELYPSSADDPRYFGTLRSFQRHQIIDDVLSGPGEQDLTTSVNWSFVRDVGEQLGFEVFEFERQDKFLLAAGLLEQLEVKTKRQEGEAENLRLSNAALEMILPTRMGAHFQVLVQKKQKPDREGGL